VIKVYHSRHARSARVLWLLEELGLPYQVVPLEFGSGALQSAEHLARHPLGRVPVIEDGAQTLFESGAIVEYLLDSYGEGRLAPEPKAPARAEYLQWFHYGEATVAGYLSEIVRYRFRETDTPALVLDRSRERFARAVAVVERVLGERPYICGTEFSAADIMVSYGVSVARIIRELPAELVNVRAYLDRLKQRPGYQRAWA
jgi:glutathione S-transferase